MTTIADLRGTAAFLGSRAELLADQAAEAQGQARVALLDESDRLLDRAKHINHLILAWRVQRFDEVVARLEGIVRDERSRSSSIRARMETLLGAARAELGLPTHPLDAGAGAGSTGEPDSAATGVGSPAPDGSFVPASQPLAAEPAEVRGAVVTAPAGPAIDPRKRDTDLAKLHPAFRDRLRKVMEDLEAAGVPMKVFEAWRAPERQAHLYARGRRNGEIVGQVVTYAKPWESYHQYGLAVDMVIDHPDFGMWDETGIANDWWNTYHEIAGKHGLEPVSFERVHVQLTGMRASALMAGEYPRGGDESWTTAITEAIDRWPGRAPPPPAEGDRPPIRTVAATQSATAGIDWSALPGVVESPFHNPENGQRWRVDRRGVYLEGDPGEPLRTPGAPLTAARAVELYGNIIAENAARQGLAPELIVMTIATETGKWRTQGFTGPETFRWEPGWEVRATGDPAIDGTQTGDYSAGPMQVIADTARWLNGVDGLGYDAATAFKFFRNKPSSDPARLGLYDPATNIHVGSAYIRRQIGDTGADPILVAAAYNAGSVRASGTSSWGIFAHGDHLDRAARWFGDACEVMASLGRHRA